MSSTPTARAWRERIIPDQTAQAWLKDVRSRFLAVSEAFADACGVTPAEMIGKTEAPFFPISTVERFRSDDRRAIAWGRLIVVREGSRDNRFRTFKVPVLDESGRVAGTVGLALPATWPRARMSRTWLELFSWRRDTNRAGAAIWLRRVRRELDVAFNAPVSVTALASKVGRDPAYVTRAFRQSYGVTPVGYAHRHRAEWIAHALATSALPLSQLAQEAGFTDQSHMTRLFARYFGITPAAYRDAMRSDVSCQSSAG
jgi:AraC-like DNA-binding protein